MPCKPLEITHTILQSSNTRDQFIYSPGMKGLDWPQSGFSQVTAQVTAVGIGDYLFINCVRTNGPTLCPIVWLPYAPEYVDKTSQRGTWLCLCMQMPNL